MLLYSEKLKQLQQSLRQFITDTVWPSQFDSLPAWQRLLVRSSQILYAIFRDLVHGQLRLRAMSLVYITLIGFVPLIALTFSVLKSLGVHNAMEPTLLAFLEPLGSRSAEVTDSILAFVDNIQVELIGISSMGVLIYIILDMMLKIETSFNYIWGVKKARTWGSRISDY
ncbi:MAG: ribonuclease BN, partial [SAR86 cluster bacterium]